MTHRQQESVARYLYDASKIILATAVVGNMVAWERFSVLKFLVGALTAIYCFTWAYLLEGGSHHDG
jgi:hypothetical protein